MPPLSDMTVYVRVVRWRLRLALALMQAATWLFERSVRVVK